MNQERGALISENEIESVEKPSKSVNFLRRSMVRVLSKAQHGHFLLRENGRVIAEVGDRNASLQAEVDVLNLRSYARALVGGNAAAGEAFVDGWWTSPDITQVTRFFSRNMEMLDYWDSRFGWIMKPIRYFRLLSLSLIHI